MASKTILLLLGLTIIAVAYGLPLLEQEEEENTALSFEDFEEYFEQMQMEKRGGKKIGRKLFYSTFFEPLWPKSLSRVGHFALASHLWRHTISFCSVQFYHSKYTNNVKHVLSVVLNIF